MGECILFLDFVMKLFVMSDLYSHIERRNK